MGIYFTADTHFFHKNIIEYENRPFADVGEMNEAMIGRWNATVKSPNDEVYILGDFALCKGREANGLLARLTGRKYLIRGNHDSFLEDKEFDDGHFVWIRDYHVLRHNKRKFVLFHYPIAAWDSQDKGAAHLYGHVHNTANTNHHGFLREMPNAVNVGVDIWGYRPTALTRFWPGAIFLTVRESQTNG